MYTLTMHPSCQCLPVTDQFCPIFLGIGRSFSCLSGMSMTIIIAFLALAAGVSAFQSNGTDITESAAISSMPSSAFVYNPVASNNLMVRVRRSESLAAMRRFCQELAFHELLLSSGARLGF